MEQVEGRGAPKGGHPERAAAGMPIPVETVLATAPMVVRRTIRFGEVDAAGVVYTCNFLDYAMEAIETWFEAVAGCTWAGQHAELGIGTPAVSCNLDFRAPLRTGDRLDVTVLIDRLGGSSYTIRTEGRAAADATFIFEGSVTFATIDLATRKPVSIPDRYRDRFTAYRDACAGAGS